MKLLVCLCLIAAVAAAPPSSRVSYPNGNVSILKYENDLGLGGYRYAYEQTDGTKAEQYGEVLNEGKENEHIAVKGSFSWVSPDGVTYKVTYTADEGGYKPEIEEGPGAPVPDYLTPILLG